MAETNPTPPELSAEDIERFWSKVDKNGPIVKPEIGPCWDWTAGKFRGGYGQFTLKPRNLKAHRVSYFLATGHWSALLVCHTCDRPCCCNPAHLFEGTELDNATDCKVKGRLNTAAGERHGSRTQPESRARGERVAGAVLSADQVAEVCGLYAAGGRSQQELAGRFGITREAVSQIVRGNNWKHVGGDVAAMAEASRKNRAASSRKCAKLDAGKVREIRGLLAESTPLVRIAERFGVKPETIGAISKGRIWRDIA